jgi:hypothetical protein
LICAGIFCRGGGCSMIELCLKLILLNENTHHQKPYLSVAISNNHKYKEYFHSSLTRHSKMNEKCKA